MGFHVDIAELIKLRDAYLESAEKVEGELDTAKNGMNGIITSNSMYGEVGKAINNEINNSHNPIIVGLKNSYTLMGVDFQKTLSDFQSAVSETSESAILDEEVLTQTKTKMTNADTKHTEYETKIGKIYSEISDLISLSCPSSSVPSSITASNKILQEAIDNVNKFDKEKPTLLTDNIVTGLGKQIEVGNQAQGLSYTDPRFVEFTSYTQLGDGIQQLDTKITEAKEQAKKEAEEAARKAKEEWEKNHPVTAWLKNTSESIGNWWNGVKEGTEKLDIPVVREILLFGEGFIGAAGSLVSSVAIMASELNDLSESLKWVAIEGITGWDVAPKWMEDDVNGAWENVKGVGDYIGRFATDEKTRAEAWEGIKNGGIQMWNDFWSDPWYNAGGVGFEVASWFVGVGEVKAGLTAAKGAGTFFQGVRTFGSTVGKAALHNADDMARSIGRLATKGDDAMRGAARGMMNLIDDPSGTMSRWYDNVLNAAGKVSDNMAERFPVFDKMRQSLANNGNELVYAMATNYGDDATEQLAKHGDEVASKANKFANNTAEGLAKSEAGRTIASSGIGQEVSEQLAKHGDEVAKYGDNVSKTLQESTEQVGKKASREVGQEATEQLAKHGDEVAKHSDEVSKTLKESTEQVGKKASQEIGQEATEQLAKHGDEVAKGLKETAEQAGKKVSQEFSKETSEQLAKHSDDVTKGLEETAEKAKKTVREVEYGEQFTKGVNGRKELLPNVQYVTESGYRYTTDEFGRISRVEVDELVLKKGKRNAHSQRVAGREYRITEAELWEGLDDGGHLIGTRFNGSGEYDNVVAMNREINRRGGAWYNMEEEWAKALKEVPPRKVSVDIQPVYSGKSLRPDSFDVTYKIEGKRLEVRNIKNQIGG